MKKLGGWCLVVWVAMACFALPALAKTKWNANSVWPPNNHHSIGLTEFAELVNTRTNGELEIIVQTGGALGYKGPELLKAVRDGLVPLSDMLTSGVAGDEPIFNIPTLPFLTRSHKEAQILSDISRPYFDKVAEQWNQKICISRPGRRPACGPKKRSNRWPIWLD